MPNWKKLIVSGSDANLNSLNITTDLTGSNALITNELDVQGSIAIGSSPPSTAALGVDGNIRGTGYLLLNDSNNQYIYASPTGRSVEIFASSSISSGDPAFRIRQDNTAKVDFGWDDDGTSEAFVWNYSNGGFKIGTNGSERFKITSDGKVGIGTTNPEVDLHLSGTSTSFSITDTNITNTSYDTLRFYAASLNKFAIGVGSGTSFPAHIAIDGASGSVGIGTISPYDSKLEVTGRIRAAGGTNGGYFFGDEEFDGGFYAPSDGNLAFSTNNVERVRIDGNGKVGIGTTSPDSKLDIQDSNPFITIQGSSSSYVNAGVQFISNQASTSRGLGNFYYSAHSDVEWFSGLPYNDNDAFVINRNASYTVPSSQSSPPGIGASAGTLLKVSSAGAIRFNNYSGTNKTGTPTYLLGTDASGNVVKTNTIPGSDPGPYLPLAGGTMTGTSGVKFPDNFNLNLGTSGDFRIFYNGNNAILQNTGGDIVFENTANDRDIFFKSDDGSGGVTPYFYLDGSQTQTIFSQNAQFQTNARLKLGSGGDLQMYHSSGISFIENNTGPLYIKNNANDQDIVFQSDNGSGGVENYIQIDGSEGRTLFNKNVRLNDNVVLQIGNSGDFTAKHNGTDSYLENFTGNFNIANYADDGDIKFWSDNGSGGVTEYFFLDGSQTNVNFQKDAIWADNKKALFGGSGDLKIYHDGNHSIIQADGTGNLIIKQDTADADIVFKSDNGSGGSAEYFRLDGANVRTLVSKPINLIDGVPLQFGNSQDLRIYHNGNNSYIQDSGVGSLKILAQDFDVINAAESALMIRAIDGAQAELYYGGAKKLETTSTGVGITGYADVTSEVLVGNNNSTFGENLLRFKSPGGAYIDHNTVGQSINFRTSVSSGLDTTPLILTGANATFAGTLTVNNTITTPTDTNLSLSPNGSGHVYFGNAGNGMKLYHYSHANDGKYSGYDFNGSYYRIFTTATSGVKIGNPLYVSGNTDIDGDLTVTGKVTAQEFHTEFVSASILYESGSTKFGDTSDDIHSFTGSVEILKTDGVPLTLRGNTYDESYLRFEKYNLSSSYSQIVLDGANNQHLVLDIDPNSESTYDAFSIKKHGTTAFIINRYDNVGIGTTDPTSKLQVYGNSTYITSKNTSNNKVVEIGADSSGDGLIILRDSSNNNKIKLYAENNADNYINNGGNVGIGTASPGSKLHVQGTSYFFDQSIFGDKVGIGTTGPSTKLHIAGVTDTAVIRLENTSTALSAGDTIGAVQFFNNDPTDNSPNVAASIYAVAGPSGGSGQLRFRTKESGVEGGAATDTMTLTNGGNVGIGTNNPGEKLDVVGRVRGERFRTTTGGSASFAAYYFLGDADTGTFQPANNTFGITTAGTERMRIDSGGNVGIGVTSVSNKLTVYDSNQNYPLRVGNNTSNTDGSYTGMVFYNSTNVGGGSTGEGSASIRAYRYSGQGNLANELEFLIAGTPVMRFDTLGNVGIGTTSPSVPLHIKADAPTIRLEDNTSSDNHYLTGNNGELRVQSTGYITIRPNNATSTTFLANGNVGINDTSAPKKLTVNGQTQFYEYGGAHLTNLATSNFNFNTLANNSASTSGGSVGAFIKVTATPTGNTGTWSAFRARAYGENTQGNTNEMVNFFAEYRNYTSTNAVTLSHHAGLKVKPLGVGGLATVTNNYGIHIDPGTAATNNYGIYQSGTGVKNFFQGKVGIGTTGPSYPLTVRSETGNVGTAFFDSVDNWERIYIGSTNEYIERKGSEQRITFAAQGSAGYFTYQTTGSEKLRIANNGNVGIGTTSTPQKLTVQGNVQLNHTSGNSQSSYDLRFNATNSSGQSQIKAAMYAAPYGNNTNGGNFVIKTANTGTTLIERFSLNAIGAARFNQYGSGTFTGTVAYTLGVDSSGNIIETTGGGSGTVSAVSNGVDNRVATFSGSDSLNGEANLTFDGSTLNINGGLSTGTANGGVWLRESSSKGEILGLNNGGTAYVDLSIRSTSGTQLHLDTDGNVGIGVVPANQNILDIRSDDTNGVFVTHRNNTGFFLNRTYADYGNDGTTVEYQERIGVDGNNSSIGNFSNHTLGIRTNNQDRITILSDGKVGIGTTTPTNELEVLGGGSPRISLRTTSETVGEALELGFQVGTGVNSSANSVGIIKSVITQANPSALKGDLVFQTNSGDSVGTKMVIKDDGKIGIGTTSPDQLLSVAGIINSDANDSYYGAWLSGNSNGSTDNYLGLGAWYSTAAYVRYIHNDRLSIYTYDDTEHVTLQESGGNVGIGTTSPASKLEISSAGANGILISKDTGAGSNSGRLFFETDTVSEGFSFVNSNGLMTIRSQAEAGNTSGNTRVAINGSGNVGIGTTDPGAKLVVVGGAASRPTFVHQSGYGGIQIAGSAEGSGASLIFSNNYNNTISEEYSILLDGANDSLVFISGDPSDVATQERMRILANGKLGIGTPSPSEKLHVDGSIKVNANGFFGPGGTVTTDAIVSIDGGSGTGGEAYLRLMRGGTPGFILNHTATAIQVRATANIPMFFYTNDTIGIKLNANSTVSFPEYGAGTLVTDASGNITVSSGGGAGGPYLPLAGGTMTTGAVVTFLDSSGSTNNRLKFGTGSDLQIYHNGSTSYVDQTGVGKLVLNTLNTGINIQAGSGETRFTKWGQNSEVKVDDATQTNKIVLKSNGNSYFNGGNVGIGVTSPNGLLHISSGTSGDALVIIESDTDNNNENDNPQLQFKQDGGNTIAKIGLSGDAGTIFTNSLANTAYFGNDEAASVQLYTNATARLTIEPDGNVGIGTNNPSAPLEIAGVTNATDTGITIKNGSATRLRLFHNDSAGSSYLTAYRGVQAAQRLIIESGNDLNLSGGGGSAHMVIKSSGNVGIGTTTPDTKLEVVLNVDNSTNTATDINANLLLHNGNSSGTAVLKLRGSGSDSGAVVFGGGIGAASDKFHIISRHNQTKRLTVQANGNVGIGVTSPSAKLDIEGDLQVKGVNISNQENLDVDTGTETIATVVKANYDAAFFDFVIKNGTNLRAGTVFAIHDGTNVEFTETSTNDLGDTSDVTLTVDISGTDMRLRATTTTDNWVIKSLVRTI